MTNETMLQDIRSQPDALAEGLGSVRRQLARGMVDDRLSRIVLAGSGDSYIAALAVRSLFEHHSGVPVVALTSLDASRYLMSGPRDLVVVASVSGEVARSIEVAARAKAAGARSLAVTAAPDSTLANTADAAITIPAPIDRTIPHSRDYSVTMLAFACILEQIGAITFPQLAKIPTIVSGVIDRSFEEVPRLPLSSGRTWFLGAGPDTATAMFGALKYWEAAAMEAWWDDLEEFGHGSQLMARPGDRAVLIASGDGCQRAVEMVPGLGTMGLETVLVGGGAMGVDGCPVFVTTDDLDARWHPFVSCVPLQVLTYVEAEARGLEVSVPLFGRPYGPAFDRVHTEWTKESRIVLADGDS